MQGVIEFMHLLRCLVINSFQMSVLFMFWEKQTMKFCEKYDGFLN